MRPILLLAGVFALCASPAFAADGDTTVSLVETVIRLADGLIVLIVGWAGWLYDTDVKRRGMIEGAQRKAAELIEEHGRDLLTVDVKSRIAASVIGYVQDMFPQAVKRFGFHKRPDAFGAFARAIVGEASLKRGSEVGVLSAAEAEAARAGL